MSGAIYYISRLNAPRGAQSLNVPELNQRASRERGLSAARSLPQPRQEPAKELQREKPCVSQNTAAIQLSLRAMNASYAQLQGF